MAAANNNNNADMAAILAALQQSVATLTQGQQDLTTIVQQLAPQQQQPVAFHLSPAQSEPGNLVDMRTRTGKAVYDETQRGEETKYDLSKSGLVTFIRAIERAAARLGCSGPQNSVVHFTAEDGGANIDIISHYGEVSVARIKTQCAIFVTGANKERRQAQNNRFLVDYTLNSLTTKARDSLLTYQKEFTVDDVIVWGLLWKRLVAVPSLDSKLTAKNLRSDIRKMPSKMPHLTIQQFNDEFTNLVTQLNARDETMEDLESIVIDAYKLANDCRFVDYWTKKETDIDDGEGPLATADWKTLLAKGIEKYNGFSQDWGQVSKQEQDFIALKTEYDELRGQLELKSPSKSSATKKSKGKPQPSSKPAKPSGKITKNKKPTGDRQRQKKDESWKKVPPKDGEPHSKTVNGWKAHWCVHHMAWCGHSSKDCELGKRRAQEQQDYKAASSTYSADPAVKHQQDFMAKLAGLSRLHE